MRRLALFAHFDAGARVRPFILQYLRELRAVCDDIIFVSTASLSEAELAKVAPYCSRAMRRPNVGFDFGMWRDAMEGLDFGPWDELVLANSSVFGPLWPLSYAFDRMRDVGCDAWGMTANFEIAWHLQSYFLVFRRPILEAPLLKSFFRGILPYQDKNQLIRSYEVGLSRLLLDHGFTLRSFAEESDLHGGLLPAATAVVDFRTWWSSAARRIGVAHRAVNPTTTQPVDLLRAGMPFVKIELLRDNPRSIPLEPVLAEMRRTGWDMSLMEFDRPFKARGLTSELLAEARSAASTMDAHGPRERQMVTEKRHVAKLAAAYRGLTDTLTELGQRARNAPELLRREMAGPVKPVFTPQQALRDMEHRPIQLPTDDAPRVSIVIPVYNKFEYTWACLRSLERVCAGQSYEVIVVDDGSSDETPRLAEAARGLRLLRNDRNLGFVGSCNRGAAEARGEYVVLLNNDTQVQDGWLTALLETFERVPDAGLVGSKLIYPDGVLQEAGGIVFRDGSAWNYGRGGDPEDPRFCYLRDVDYVSGASIMLPRKLFAELGGFDPLFAPCYYEDTDLAFRVRAAGKRVLLQPLSRVTHYEGVTAGTDVSQGPKRYQVINAHKFFDRWRDTLASYGEPGRDIETVKERKPTRRVLVVDSYVPLTDQDSGSVRMDALMRIFAGMGFKVTFFPDNGQYPQPHTDALRARGVEVLTVAAIGSLRRHLEKHGGLYEVVVLSRADVGARMIDDVRRFCTDARILFDTVDLHYVREMRTAALEGDEAMRRNALARKEQELGVAARADVTLVVSQIERETLRSERPFLNVEVVSNIHRVHGRGPGFEGRTGILFVAGFRHPPNVDAIRWFTSSIWPMVRTRLRGAVLHVVGSEPPEEVRALAAADVVIHGYQKDLTPYLEGCRLSIAPLRVGAGVKGKINQSMSHGLPVVGTTVATEGMSLVHEEDVLVADRPDDFADAIVRLHEDRELWEKLSDGGLRNVQQHFSDDVARAALLRALDPGKRSRGRLVAFATRSAHDAEVARRAGVEGLCHRYSGEPSAIDEILRVAPPDLSLCLAWTAKGPIRLENGDARHHFARILPLLTDRRAITVDGRPVLLVDRELGDMTSTVALFRELASDAGLPGLYVLSLEATRNGVRGAAVDPRKRGFDGVVEPSIDRSAIERLRARGNVFQNMIRELRRRAEPDPVILATVDESARPSFPLVGAPLYETHRDDDRTLDVAVERLRSRLPEYRLVFLHSWNEAYPAVRDGLRASPTSAIFNE